MSRSISEHCADQDTTIAAQAAELEEQHNSIWRASELLTSTANALKGAPADLTNHSWHDLPEIAAAQAARITALEYALHNVSVWLECDTDAIGRDINNGAADGNDIHNSTAHARRIIREALSGDDQ